MSTTISITISPPYEDGGHEAFNIKSFMDKIAKHLFVVGKEQGSKGKIHYQIALTIENYKRSNFIRDYIKPSMLKQFDISKHSKALVINVHDDEKYLFGYCMKENNYNTNLSPGLLEYCKLYYQNTKLESKKQFHTCNDKITNDQIAEGLIQHCLDNDFGLCDDGTYRKYMTTIRNKFKYSQFARLNKDKLLEYVNFHLSGSVKKNIKKINSFDSIDISSLLNNQQ